LVGTVHSQTKAKEFISLFVYIAYPAVLTSTSKYYYKDTLFSTSQVGEVWATASIRVIIDNILETFQNKVFHTVSQSEEKNKKEKHNIITFFDK
jgi:hypothetical protein